MPYISPEVRKQLLINRGLDPNQYSVDDLGYVRPSAPAQPQPSTSSENVGVFHTVPDQRNVIAEKPAESFGRAAAGSAIPTGGGLLGGLAGGAALGTLTGGPIGTVLGGIGGAIGGSMGAEYLQDKLLPDWIKQKFFPTQEGAAANPSSTFWGGMAPSALAFSPAASLRNVVKGGALAGESLLTRTYRNLPNIQKQALQNLALNAGINAGVGGGMNVYQQMQGDQPFDYGTLARDVAVQGLLFNQPRAPFRKFFGDTTIPERPPGIVPPMNLDVGVPTIEQGRPAPPLSDINAALTPAEISAINNPALYPTADVLPHGPVEPPRVEPAKVAAQPTSRAKGGEVVPERAVKPAATAADILSTIKAAGEEATLKLAAEHAKDIEITQAEAANLAAKNATREQAQSESKLMSPEELDYNQTKAEGKKFLGERGVRFGTEGQIATAGELDIQTRTASIGPAGKRGGDTIFHEGAHQVALDMAISRDPKDHALLEKGFQAAGQKLTRADYLALNKRLDDAVMRRDPAAIAEVKAQLALTEEPLAEALGQRSYGRFTYGKAHKVKQFANDVLAAWKVKLGTKDSQVVLDYFNSVMHREAPYGSRTEFLPKESPLLHPNYNIGQAALSTKEAKELVKQTEPTYAPDQEQIKEGVRKKRGGTEEVGTQTEASTSDSVRKSEESKLTTEDDHAFVDTNTSRNQPQSNLSQQVDVEKKYRKTVSELRSRPYGEQNIKAEEPGHIATYSDSLGKWVTAPGRFVKTGEEKKLAPNQVFIPGTYKEASFITEKLPKYEPTSNLKVYHKGFVTTRNVPSSKSKLWEPLLVSDHETMSKVPGSGEPQDYYLSGKTMRVTDAESGDLEFLRKLAKDEYKYVSFKNDSGGDSYAVLDSTALSKTPPTSRRALPPSVGEDVKQAVQDISSNRFSGVSSLKRPSEDTFELQANKELRSSEPFGIKIGTDKRLPGNTVADKLPNIIPKGEYEILKQAGIEEYLRGHRRTPAEIENWIKENGPRVEVAFYGMEGKVSEAKKEYDKMTHEWYENATKEEKDANENLTGLIRAGVSAEDAIKQLRLENSNSDSVAKIVKYAQLRAAVIDEEYAKSRDTSPRATSYYSSVSAFDTTQPMPEWTKTKSGKNVQRVDVVIPGQKALQDKLTAKYGADWSGKDLTPEESKQWKESADKWKQDNLHENLPNTLGWAMIQYTDSSRILTEMQRSGTRKSASEGFLKWLEANPDAKIAVIAEAQSRWGQHERTIYATATPHENQDGTWRQGSGRMEKAWPTKEEAQAAIDKEKAQTGHPLLRDYNRLILKAAIEQARKEGATHILISDAETAMMTERHDLQAQTLYKNPKTGEVYEHNAGEPINKERLKELGYTEIVRKAEQEPGMRLNYDTILPKIVEELTGSKGEKVSLGEHKNAFEPDKSAQVFNRPLTREEIRNQGGKTPRSNLIFRNADGTPKTDVSGNLYDIRPVSEHLKTEPFTLHGKRFQEQSLLTDDQSIPRGPLKFFSGDLDLLRGRGGVYKEAANAMNEVLDVARSNSGKYETKILNPLNKLSPKEQKELYDHLLREDTEQKVSDLDNPRLQTAYEAVRAGYKLIHDDQRAAKQPIKTAEGKYRQAISHEYSWFNVPSKKVIETINSNVSGKEYEQLKQEFIDHYTEKGKTETQALEAFKDIKAQYGGSSYKTNFGAVRREEGMGLPQSWIEPDFNIAAKRYINRVSRDRAWFDVIEKNDNLNRMFGNQRNAAGDPYLGSFNDNIITDPLVKRAAAQVAGFKDYSRSTIVDALSRLVSALMLGPLTGLGDVVSTLGGMLKYVAPHQIPEVLTSYAKAINKYKTTLETGLNRSDLSSIYDVVELGSGIEDKLNNITNLIYKYSGRQFLERASRSFGQAAGETIASIKLAEARNGNTKAESFLKMVSNDRDYTALSLEELGTRIAERQQGTYDVRQLPYWAIDGSIAPFLKLARWNLGQANEFAKSVVNPALKGDIAPLITSLFGAAASGYIIKDLRERVSNKKDLIPSLSEISAGAKENKADLYAWNIAGAMAYAGLGGIMGDMTKAALDVMHKNRPQGFTFPTVELGVDLVSKASQVADAIASGEDISKVAMQFTTDMAKQHVQILRLALSNMDKVAPESKQARDFQRTGYRSDLRKFNQVQGEDVPFMQSGGAFDRNPYLDLSAKEFKRTEDIGEAVGMLPELLGKAVEEARGNPEKLKENLRSLKMNSYQTMPNPDKMPLSFAEYVVYLNKTQGPEAAQKRLVDYFSQREKDKLKSSLIPTL